MRWMRSLATQSDPMRDQVPAVDFMPDIVHDKLFMVVSSVAFKRKGTWPGQGEPSFERLTDVRGAKRLPMLRLPSAGPNAAYQGGERKSFVLNWLADETQPKGIDGCVPGAS